MLQQHDQGRQGRVWDSSDPRRQALNLFTPIAIAGLQADAVTRNTCNMAMVVAWIEQWCENMFDVCFKVVVFYQSLENMVLFVF